MDTILKHSKLLCCFAAASLMLGGTGCSISDFKPSKLFSLDNTWPFGDDIEEGTPVRVVGAWTDTVLTKQGEKPQRGFGGRLAFYDNDHEKSVLVDGELVVYAFDELGRDPTNNKPTRRYVFPADQMKLRMSESDLGATYSFFLPWDEAGGPRAEVSLVCRFQPKKGPVVVGEQTKHRLDGPEPVAGADGKFQAPALPEGVPSRPAQQTLETLKAQQQQLAGGPQQASYQVPVEPSPISPALAAEAQPAKQMTVTSISLPDNFQYRDFAAAARHAIPAAAAAGQVTQPAQQVQTPATQMPTQPAPQQPAAYPQPQQFAPPPGAQPMPPQPQPAPQYNTAAGAQLGQPLLEMPRVYAPQISAFGNNVYAPSPVAPPQALPAARTSHNVQLQPGQPMPGPTPVQTTVSSPNQVLHR
jgi:hypothetical protein